MLPRTVEGPDVVGVVSEAAAAVTGLRAGTPVVGGAGDQAANAVGVGAVVPGIGAMSVGTSGVVFVPTAGPAIEPEGRLHAFCHAVPGTWHLMGVTLSAAGSLKWLRDALAPERSWDELTALAEAVPPGSDGLVFLPYLSGERTPYPDPLARGAFVGLTVRHGLGHMVRAVLEGVAFSLRDVFELVRETSPEPLRDLRASGGGTNSPLWRQIIADVLGVPLSSTRTAEGVASGAAILAAVAAGWYPSVAAACEAMVEVTGTTEPGPQAGAYEAAYAVYRDLYPALKESFVRSRGRVAASRRWRARPPPLAPSALPDFGTRRRPSQRCAYATGQGLWDVAIAHAIRPARPAGTRPAQALPIPTAGAIGARRSPAASRCSIGRC